MVVAKRKRKERRTKMEQKKIPGPDREPQGKQRALLASPVYTGQAQGEEGHTKRGANMQPSLLLGQPPSGLANVFSFVCQIKPSCNREVTLVRHFKFLLQ